MKRLVALLAMLPLLAMATAPASSKMLSPRVEQAIQARIAANQYPAMVVVVVDSKQSHVFGFGKLAGGKAPDANTVFEIGSVTKTFTATLLAQDVLAGSVKPDTPVGKLLPGFTLPSRDGKFITLENLATQHSGLPRLPANLAPADMQDPYADYDVKKLQAFLSDYTLTRDPGSTYEYSNLGVGLLGYALATHAGMSYGALLQKRIFAPLGMTSSATHLDATMRTRLAQGHDNAGKPVGVWNFDALAGAGAIKSTGEDMLQFLKANMGLVKSALYPAMQLARRPRAKVSPSEQIGLVWMTHHDKDGDVIWHNGMTGGFASFIGFRVDGSRGVVVLVNQQVSVDDIGMATLLADTPLAPSLKHITLPTMQLDEYLGNYQLSPGFILTLFRQDDQLYAQATGQDAFPVFASAKDEFFANVACISLSFNRDTRDRVSGLVLHQNGDRAAPRMPDDATPAEGATSPSH